MIIAGVDVKDDHACLKLLDDLAAETTGESPRGHDPLEDALATSIPAIVFFVFELPRARTAPPSRRPRGALRAEASAPRAPGALAADALAGSSSWPAVRRFGGAVGARS